MGGFFLSLTAALCWGVLPLALKRTLDQLDPLTVTFYRFAFAAAALLAIPKVRKGIGATSWTFGIVALLVMAAGGLFGNYVLFLAGVQHSSPNNAQVMIQSAPMLFALTSAFLFKERISPMRGVAFAGLLGGLCLFSWDQLATLLGPDAAEYSLGSTLVVASAVAWVFYAVGQKVLLRIMPSLSMLALLFLAGALVFCLPAKPLAIFEMDSTHLLLLAFCSINTVVAYGAFAEALRVWDASRVSAVLSISPILTMISTALVQLAFPGAVNSPQIHLLGVCGAFLVVGSSMGASLIGSKKAST